MPTVIENKPIHPEDNFPLWLKWLLGSLVFSLLLTIFTHKKGWLWLMIMLPLIGWNRKSKGKK